MAIWLPQCCEAILIMSKITLYLLVEPEQNIVCSQYIAIIIISRTQARHPIAHLWGRGITREWKVWPKCYHCNGCFVHTIVLYMTAIYIKSKVQAMNHMHNSKDVLFLFWWEISTIHVMNCNWKASIIKGNWIMNLLLCLDKHIHSWPHSLVYQMD